MNTISKRREVNNMQLIHSSWDILTVLENPVNTFLIGLIIGGMAMLIADAWDNTEKERRKRKLVKKRRKQYLKYLKEIERRQKKCK